MRQFVRENTALRRLYYRAQLMRPKAQSDEAEIIESLAATAPRNFVEFGFHPIQFNCIGLAKDPAWRGLLVDGSARQVDDARALFPDRVQIVQRFLTLENLDLIRASFENIGVLSIDVDGNDYWFLEALIDTRPAVISVEYNSTFGLESITVPYDAEFNRHKKHPSGWYHGASLTALCRLCTAHGYGLAAVSAAGANAFFTPSGQLDPAKSWRPNTFRQQYSGVDHNGQWDAVKNLPFVRV